VPPASSLACYRPGSTQPPVSYSYDAANKLLTASQNGATVIRNFTGDPVGWMHSVTLLNGLVVTYGYDKNCM